MTGTSNILLPLRLIALEHKADRNNQESFRLNQTDPHQRHKTCMFSGYSALSKGKKLPENGVGFNGLGCDRPVSGKGVPSPQEPTERNSLFSGPAEKRSPKPDIEGRSLPILGALWEHLAGHEPVNQGS